jgi:hypothetical protein
MSGLFNPRRLARAMLQGAMRIAPAHAAEWGQAMLCELHYVEGNWTALAWAVGGAGVLMKQALFSLFIPGPASQMASSDRQFFAKEKSMRKSTLIAAAACLAASLLFFAAPAFRQAFALSLRQWHALVGSLYGGGESPYPGTDYLKMADRARKNHDAEGLAFVAAHGWGTPNAGAVADEAIQIDPNLTWIYAVAGARNWSQPEFDQRIGKLEEYDPQNATPHLIDAQRVQYQDFARGGFRPGKYADDPAWQNAMAAAFASPKLDLYADQLQQLDYNVSRRYGFDDPYEVESQYFLSNGISPGFGNSMDYAKSLLNSGDALAARGDSAGALKQYWLVVHFGEMMWPPQHRTYDVFRIGIFASVFLEEPYKHLAAFYSKRADREQAEFFNYLVDTTKQARLSNSAAARQFFAGTPAEQWNANILGASGIALFLCASVLLVCAVVTLARSLRAQPRNLQSGPLTNLLGGASAVGVLVSSSALYLSYRPYDELVRAYLRDGDPSHLQTLIVFLSFLNYDSYPPKVGTLYNLRDFPVYFWAATIVLCIFAVIFVAVRYVSNLRRSTAAA